MTVVKKFDTRMTILDAAERVFVSDGYQGATFERIARIARVAPSLISHYFKSKVALWTEVKARVLAPLAVERIKLLNSTTGTTELQAAMAGYIHWLRQNPRALRLTLWLAVLNEDVLEDKIGAEFFETLVNWGKNLGNIPSHVDARSLALLLLAMAEYPEGNKTQAAKISGPSVPSEAERAYAQTLDWALERMFAGIQFPATAAAK